MPSFQTNLDHLVSVSDPILTGVNEEENKDGIINYSFPAVTETSWLDRYRQYRNSGCLWRLHRAALNKMLLVLSAGLIMTALVTCFLSACSSEDKKSVGKKVMIDVKLK